MLNKEQQLHPVYFSQIAFQYQQILTRNRQEVFNELSNISAKTLLLMSVCIDLNNTNYQTGKLSFNSSSKRNLKKPNSFNSHSNRPATISTTDNWFVASFTDSAPKHSYQNIEGRSFNLLESVGSYISTKITLDKVTQSVIPTSKETASIKQFVEENKIRDYTNSGDTCVSMSNDSSITDKFAPLVRDSVEAEVSSIKSTDRAVAVHNINQNSPNITESDAIDINGGTHISRQEEGQLYYDNLVKHLSVVSDRGDNSDISHDELDDDAPFMIVADSQNHKNDQVEDIVEGDIEIVEEQRETALPRSVVLPVSINYDILQESSEDLVKAALPLIDNIKKQQVFSPLPGKIVNICVNKGQTVARGELLLVIEMMKMQVNINASCDAVITDVFVEQDDILPAGQVLFALTEYDPI